MHGDVDALPPRHEPAFTGLELDHQPFVRGRATQLLAHETLRLVLHAVAVVHVKHAAAVLARIHVERQRAIRHLLRALHQRLTRQDRAGAHEHRQVFELRRFRQRDRLAVVGCRHLEASPIVVPAAGWQAHPVILWRFRCRRRGHQQLCTQQERHRLVARQRGRIRILIEQRPHQRRAGARILVGQRVNVGQQAVAFLDEPSPDRGVFRSVHPWFGARRVDRGMVAEQRHEGGELEPARHQFRRGAAGEAANVDRAVREATQPQVEQLRHRQLEVAPGRAVVAGPRRGITLATSVARARHHEGALVGPQPAQALEGRARVLHAIDVVDLGVRRLARGEAGRVDAMHDIERHGLGRRAE